MATEYRACGKDEGDLTFDHSEWFASREDAENEHEAMGDAEPPYDFTWIESREVSAPVALREEQRG